MQMRRLGRTDLSIAPLVFGGNVFGWTADKKTSFELLDRFVGRGLQCDRHRRRLFGLGARQQGRRIRDDHRRMDEEPGQSRPGRRRHQGRLADGPGQEGAFGALHRRGRRGLAEAAADRRHRPLSRRTGPIPTRLTRKPSAPIANWSGRARCASSAPRTSTRHSSPPRSTAAKAQVAAALRRPAARIQSLRPRLVRRPAARSVHRRGDRRHHLLQPRQGLPVGQIPQRGGSRARARAAAGSRPISTRAGVASWPPSISSRRGTRPSPPKSRSPG